MKTLARNFIAAALFAYTNIAAAGVCNVDDALVTGMFQWEDGHVFIEFDRDIGCGCPALSRAAFHKDENQKFHMAAALTAFTTGRRVSIRADNVDGTCPVHGNTPRLLMLRLKSG
jgi:hypothetical protein